MSGPLSVDPATIEALKLIVLGYVGAGLSKVGMAPFDAVAEQLKAAVGARLDDLIRRARRKSDSRPLGANPRAAIRILNEAAPGLPSLR
jgi:hypothetical protein